MLAQWVDILKKNDGSSKWLESNTEHRATKKKASTQTRKVDTY